MNSRHLPFLALVACLTAGVAWWLWPAAPVPAKTPVVQLPTPPEVTAISPDLLPPEEAAMPPGILPPEEPAEPLPAPAADAPVPPPMFDPQAELSTTIPAMIQALNSGEDIWEFGARFSLGRLPPQVTAALTMFKQDPAYQAAMRQQMESMVVALQSIQNVTPVYDATGDQATYTLSVPLNIGGAVNKNTLSFVKLNGQWFLKGGTP